MSKVIAVCWSMKVIRFDYTRSPLHEQGLPGRTLCGIATDGSWNFAFHGIDDGDVGVTCRRCKRIKEST